MSVKCANVACTYPAMKSRLWCALCFYTLGRKKEAA